MMPTRGHVLITGASTGIGRACASYLAARGFAVMAGVRREADAAGIRDEAKASGPGEQLQPLLIDVTDAASIAAAREAVERAVGDDGLMGLVNNAGIGIGGPVEFVPLDDWRRQFEVNLFGQIAVTQAMLPLLRRRVERAGYGSARIVMMSSIAGLVGQPILSPYAASKHALEAVADALRIELAEQGIRTSSVEPGPIQSEIWRKANEIIATVDRSSEKYRMYAKVIDGVVRSASAAERGALPAVAVARVVERCLVARKPPARVLVGRDAKLGALAEWLLPASMFDALILRALGIRR